MKKLFFLGCITLLFACNPKPIAKITGVINNQVEDVVIISNSLLNTNDTLSITDNSFTGSIKIEQAGIYHLKNGKYGIQLYLKPGAELNIQFDIQKLKTGEYNTTIISGEGSDESKLMNDLKSFQNIFPKPQKL